MRHPRKTPTDETTTETKSPKTRPKTAQCQICGSKGAPKRDLRVKRSTRETSQGPSGGSHQSLISHATKQRLILHRIEIEASLTPCRVRTTKQICQEVSCSDSDSDGLALSKRTSSPRPSPQQQLRQATIHKPKQSKHRTK